jgi:hypothetical protein
MVLLFKVEISLMEEEVMEDILFMVELSLIKILQEHIHVLVYYLWLIAEEIQIHLNFL